jgi:hypothetical protein
MDAASAHGAIQENLHCSNHQDEESELDSLLFDDKEVEMVSNRTIPGALYYADLPLEREETSAEESDLAMSRVDGGEANIDLDDAAIEGTNNTPVAQAQGVNAYAERYRDSDLGCSGYLTPEEANCEGDDRNASDSEALVEKPGFLPGISPRFQLFQDSTRLQKLSARVKTTVKTPIQKRQAIYQDAMQRMQISKDLDWEKNRVVLKENFEIFDKAERSVLETLSIGNLVSNPPLPLSSARMSTKRDGLDREDEPRGTKRRQDASEKGDLQYLVDPGSDGQYDRNNPKRIKNDTWLMTKRAVKLEVLKPQPIQLDFPPHTGKDHTDKWYVEMFQLLARRLDKFSAEYFTVHDLNKGEFYQPWTLDFKPEFLNYVEQVAEPDPMRGGWNALLRDTGNRKSLISAILMRILQNNVFSENLFGADKREEDSMASFERAFFDREGLFVL